MGTVALSSSMAHAHASSAALRCGDDTAITTLASFTGQSPVLCQIDIRRTSHFAMAVSHSLRSSFIAIGTYASYSSLITFLPWNVSLVVPTNDEIAPHDASSTLARMPATSNGAAETPVTTRPSADVSTHVCASSIFFFPCFPFFPLFSFFSFFPFPFPAPGRNASTTSSCVSMYTSSFMMLTHAGIDTNTSSIVSRIAFGFPGRLSISVSPRNPAVCLDSTAVGTTLRLMARICSAYPGIIRSHTASVASGVTSRAAGPVPPVVTIRQQSSSSAMRINSDRIRAASSGITA